MWRARPMSGMATPPRAFPGNARCGAGRGLVAFAAILFVAGFGVTVALAAAGVIDWREGRELGHRAIAFCRALVTPSQWGSWSMAGKPEGDAAAATVTWSRDIAPILFEHCAGCHRPDGIAPFSVLRYEDVEPWAWPIAVATAKRRMPPWPPAPGDYAFRGERRLGDAEIALIRRWADQGAVEGDAAEAPAAPELPEGWRLGEPDLVVSLAEPYPLPAEGGDIYRNFVLPAPVDEPRWVRAVEIEPGNKRIVHHAILQIDRLGALGRRDRLEPGPGFGGMELEPAENPGGHFIGWSPGRVPQPLPEGMAWRLEPGTDLVLQLHLLPSGEPEAVAPRVGLYFTDEPARAHPFALVVRSSDIDIPPGDDRYVVEAAVELPVDVEVLSVYPHAHYVGKEILARATLPDGRRRTLIHIPDWDFFWQDEYHYAEPVRLPAGTRVSARFVYDNSAANPRNPNNPPKRVVAGVRSTDEMAILMLQVLPERESDHALLREAVMRARLEADPQNWFAHNLLGVALRAQGRLEEAVRHFEASLAASPGHPMVLYNLGNALAEAGRLEAAVGAYREVLAVDPEHAKVRNNLAVALHALGRAEAAAEHLRAQLERTPLDARAHHNLGLALADAGRFDEAIARFRRASELDPALAEARVGLADALRRQGRLDEALSQYRRALEIAPGLATAHYGAGLAHLAGGELAEALARFRAALDREPRLVEHANNLAWRLATDPAPARRRPQAALALAELCAQATGHRVPEVLDTLAAAYAADGRFARAAEVAERALEQALASGSRHAEEFAARLELYRAGRAYLKTAPAQNTL